MSNQVFFVELDALLDTRLGTLKRMSESDLQAVRSSDYYNRKSDFFSGVDLDKFRELYEKRDVETLMESNLTGLVLVLEELIHKTLSQLISVPLNTGVELMLNVWPYEVTSEDIEELIVAIKYWMKIDLPVTVVRMHPSEVTPKFMKEKLTALFVYEFSKWLDGIVPKLTETPIPNVSVFAPALFVETNPTDEEIEEQVKTVMHPLALIEFTLKPVLNFQFMDVKNFSIIDPESLTSSL